MTFQVKFDLKLSNPISQEMVQWHGMHIPYLLAKFTHFTMHFYDQESGHHNIATRYFLDEIYTRLYILYRISQLCSFRLWLGLGIGFGLGHIPIGVNGEVIL